MKRVLLIIFGLIILTIVYFSWFSKAPLNIANGGTIIIGIPGEVESLNPLFTESVQAKEITHLLMLGLADLNKDLDFQPEIAERWESSKDYLKLTYYLKKNARWSDGVPITADDVAFTFDLIMDSSVASLSQGLAEFIKSVNVIDKHTVEFEFIEPYPTQIFDTAGEIVPKHILKDADRKNLRTHTFSHNPLSSGPFMLKRWESRQFIELAPNPNYFGNKPYLDRIIFKVIPDQTARLLQLETGEIDMMASIPHAEVSRLLKKNGQLQMCESEGRVYYFIGYNHKRELFNNAEVRRALTMAINRQEIIDALLYGYGKACSGPLPPMLKWAYDNQLKPLPFDRNAARILLEQHGWIDSDGDGILDKDGQKFEFTLTCSAGNRLKSDVAVVVQSQLKEIGINVNLQQLEWTTLLKRLQQKDFDAVVNGWSTPYFVDPTPVFHSTATNMFNFVSYANPSVDQLIETGRVEMDREQAAKIWKNFQQHIAKDQPYTFLFWINKIAAVHKRFGNVTPLALSSVYDIEYWYDSNAIPTASK